MKSNHNTGCFAAKKLWFYVIALLIVAGEAMAAAKDDAKWNQLKTSEEWVQLEERRDFEIGDPEKLYQQALEMLEKGKKDGTWPHFNAANAGKHIVISAHSDQYNADLVAVFIEDRGGPGANMYDFAVWGWPDMELWSGGGAIVGGMGWVPSAYKPDNGFALSPNPTLDELIDQEFEYWFEY